MEGREARREVNKPLASCLLKCQLPRIGRYLRPMRFLGSRPRVFKILWFLISWSGGASKIPRERPS